MGRTILRICPYVDVVAHVEGELVLADLVRALRRGDGLGEIAGISHRDADGTVVTGSNGELYRPGAERLPLDYDPYFRRLERLGILDKMNPWLPFESSRGCWYGQKVQCTFCGLHEIMSFREWEADAVLGELERLAAKYGIGRFYCMDLILPRGYFKTLLPEIVRRGHDWMFFYEVKANMRRRELEVLADAGVRWVQPGIESLDGDLLKLMRKGVSASQNVLLLKWTQELGIFCGWNLLYGLPGETQDAYDRMEALIPKLVHLEPPSGGGRFQLHRFSPYFDDPAGHGIRWTGAHPMFRHAFPIAKADLDDLVYLHEFELDYGREAVDTSRVEAAVRAWQRAFRRGAGLALERAPDGSSVVTDRRRPDEPPAEHRLDPAETALYVYLDEAIARRNLATRFAEDQPEAFRALGGEAGVDACLEAWLHGDLAVTIDGKVLGLALDAGRDRAPRAEPAVPASNALDTEYVPLPAR